MAENDQAQEKTRNQPSDVWKRLGRMETSSSKEMFVFASSIAGLFVLMVLGFSGKVINGWASLFEFSTLRITNLKNITRLAEL